HADTKAEEGPAFAAHAFFERLDHALDRIKTAPAIGERADARKHDAIGAAHRLGIARDQDRLLAAGFARRALERLGGRMQIAGAVIDDRHCHGRPPGCGNRPITSPPAAGRIGSAADGSLGRRLPQAAGWRIQAPKKRRSASSGSSLTTTPTFVHLRRASAQRRKLEASKPTSSETTNAIPMVIPGASRRNCAKAAIPTARAA